MLATSYRINKREILAIFIILILALTVRAIYFKDYGNTDAYPILSYSDSYSYFLWAKDISSGDILGSSAFMKWPLYAYFLGFLFKLFGSNVALVYALQSMLGAVNCVLVYFIAKIIFNRKVAFLAALFCVWYAVFIFYDSLLIYNSLSLFLNSLLFLFILHIQNHPTKKKLFWAGILLGISTITQASILFFGVLAIAWILRQNRLSFKKLVYNFSYFALGLSIVIGSVILRNYLAERDFVLIAGNTGFNFYSGNNPEADGRFYSPLNIALNQDGMFRDAKLIARATLGRELKTSEVSRFWFDKATAFIKNKPIDYLKLLLRKLGLLFSPEEFFHEVEYHSIADKIGIFKIMFSDLRFILPFAFLGMILNLRNFKKTALLYLILITLSFSIILFFVTTRYRLSMVPFLIIFASYGIFGLWEALRQRHYFKLGGLCLALFLIFALNNYQAFHKSKPGYLEPGSSDFRYHLRESIYYNNEKSDYENAIKEVKIALDMQPNNHYCLLTYGTIYFNMQDFKMAEEKFKEAIRAFPLCVDAYYNLGFLYNIQRRFDAAKNALSEAVSLDPENAEAHFELGKAYKAIGEYKKSGSEFNLALKKINRWRTEERAIIARELADLK